MIMASGQLASYDQIKEFLLSYSWFEDNTVTHLASGSIAGVIATIITSPVDVIKTRMMNMKSNEYSGEIVESKVYRND
jgi:ABC-type proline/glycine betaine transport system permease subunit